MVSRPGSVLLSFPSNEVPTLGNPTGGATASGARPVMSWVPPGPSAVPRLAFAAGTGAANSNNGGSGQVRYASPQTNLSSVSSVPTVGKGGAFRWQQTGPVVASTAQGAAPGEQSVSATPRTSPQSAVVVGAVTDEAGLRAAGAPKGTMQEKKHMLELPDRSGLSANSAAPSSNGVPTGGGSITVCAPPLALPPAAPQQASGTYPVGTSTAAGSRSVAVPMVVPPTGTAPAASATTVPAVRVLNGGSHAVGMTPRQNVDLLSPPAGGPASVSVGLSQATMQANASHRARSVVVEPQQPPDALAGAQGSVQRWVSPARGMDTASTGMPLAVTPVPAASTLSPPTEPPSWIKPPGGWLQAPAAVWTNQNQRQASTSPAPERRSGAVRGTTGGRPATRKAEAGAVVRSGSLTAPNGNAVLITESVATTSEAGTTGERAISMPWSASPRAVSPTPRYATNGGTVLPTAGLASPYPEAPTLGSCEAPVTSPRLPRALSPPASFTVPAGRAAPSSFSASAAGAPPAPASFAALAAASGATGEKAIRSFSSTALVKRCASSQVWTEVAPPGGSVAAPPGSALPSHTGYPACPPPGGTVSAPPGDPLQGPQAAFAARMHRSVSSQTAQDLAQRSAAVPIGFMGPSSGTVAHRMPSSSGTSRASTPPGQQRAAMFTTMPAQMSMTNIEHSPISLRRQTENHSESVVPEECHQLEFSYGSDAMPESAGADANGTSFYLNGPDRDNYAGDVLLDETYCNGVYSVPDLQPRHHFESTANGAGGQARPHNARPNRVGGGSMTHPPAVSGSGATSSRHTLPAGSVGSAGVRGTSISREDSRGGTPLKQRSVTSLNRPHGVSPRSKDRRSTGSPQERSESAPRASNAPADRASTNDQPSRRTGGVSPRSSPLKAQQEPSLQLRLSMAMMAEEHGMAPGAADKWKVLQLFHESLPRGTVRVERIDRLAGPQQYRSFLEIVGEEDCEVGFYAPAGPSQLSRLRESGFCIDDFEEVPGLGFGVPVASHAGAAHQRARGSRSALDCDISGGERCLCVMLCAPLLFCRSASTQAGSNKENGSATRNGGDQPTNWREYCVLDPNLLLISYTVWYQQLPEDRSVGPRDGNMTPPAAEPDRRLALTERRRKQMRQQREYAKVRDPLIKVALQGLERVADGTMSTVLLPTTSVEAESVVSLYLLGGGGSRVNRPPGVDPREALGGVVVQRIENQPLFREYSALAAAEGAMSDSQNAGGENGNGSSQPRYREDVVWHGTRLKKADGEGASLATKLQSIAEKGFDPQRCMKGAAAEGGIWVATTPLASFGHGCDGLVAFVLCLSKTHFNEWVDATCARVLQRERVLPLYSLVHA